MTQLNALEAALLTNRFLKEIAEINETRIDSIVDKLFDAGLSRTGHRARLKEIVDILRTLNYEIDTVRIVRKPDGNYSVDAGSLDSKPISEINIKVNDYVN